MSIGNVSYEAQLISVFSMIQEGKTWTIENNESSQSAPLAAPNLPISCLLSSVQFNFRLIQVASLRQTFEMSHADLKEWQDVLMANI